MSTFFNGTPSCDHHMQPSSNTEIVSDALTASSEKARFVLPQFDSSPHPYNAGENCPAKSPYQIITEFAKWFTESTKINDVSDFEKLLINFGADIRHLSTEQWLSNRYNFLEISGVQKIKLSICKDFESNLKKVFYTQALGHYMLHSHEGKKQFTLKNLADKTIQGQEGLCFSLGVLLPDNIFLLVSHLPNTELAHLFRVPKEIVAVKRKFLIKEKLIQS